MTYYASPFWLRWIFPSGLLWRVKTNNRQVFLTFDDGPIPEVTPKVLNILDQYNVKATFFCVGENVEKHPEIYQLLLKNGHQTGNHSYHHIKGWQTNNTTYFEEVDTCSKLVNSNLYRPPHGQITKTQARYLKKKYKIVMWSNLSGDYNATLSEEQCFRNSVKNLKSGAIIVFHDSLKARDRMFPVLPRFIEYCINQGYSFGTL